ncbi:hypothetical protein JQM68_12920 [Oscillibacter valericigenes]|uniref:hypothetical protein n=1 Tax=Oscillibacter valericigenes TaxID=351091 RepID=UPI001F32EBF6|nr:hypothetical protein [Oscillibacter valericigenes]MCF2618087.1 hypothetical protein [Oscillibacter valericigenes]
MKQTEHYGLNQWELADRIRMEDFNGDNEKVDAALKGQAEALAAETAAREELAAAVAACGNCKIAYGTYTGNGNYGSDHPNCLTFPFEPKLVIVQNKSVASAQISGSNSMSWGMMTAIRPLNGFILDGVSWTLRLTWSGNSLSWYNTVNAELQMNKSDNTYLYLALG